jgi:CRP-like cAMP-binding protein
MDHSMDSGHNLKMFLNRLTSRSVLTSEEQQAVLDLPCHAEHVQPNRDLVKRGDRPVDACLVVAGLVGRFGQNKDGSRQITAIHFPGDIADLYSVMLPEVPASLQAISVATILRIPHPAIRHVAARYPAIAEAFWRDCAVDAVILSQWVANMGRKDAKGRLAHLLCETAIRLDAVETGDEVRFRFAVTQANLADATGMTPVHLNRTIKALRNECLADIRKSSVHIYDWTRLVAAADFDAAYLARGRLPEGVNRDGERPKAA